MTLKKYLFLMTTATLVCWGALALVLVFVNPYTAGIVGMIFFYIALFLGLLGIFSIIGFVFRFLFKRNEFAYNQVKTAFRQGMMFALLLTMMFILQGARLLVWWNIILLIILLAGIEYVFIIREQGIKKSD
ncbi:hypothetical protein A3B87_03230 [Candidatus Kuenenbacteria bacterium RIFCSPHIGHO2_02_FULL_39_13]|uniref:Major facilitator superfamily (MFS) profile domain-containing protein n=1 Tax=Candidatus Kuenenbacteria bacterium RIFCSPHIGHO2_02_FULL_39_13 TaxID=1798561 RepID=A0A1F6FMW4_9BACT|nr:MAG: hypothetical protein A3B87_03230 [Candidatus Kuenenbacteria bacterium RIFCSPHIGHO2_02_FULL_39_13]